MVQLQQTKAARGFLSWKGIDRSFCDIQRPADPFLPAQPTTADRSRGFCGWMVSHIRRSLLPR